MFQQLKEALESVSRGPNAEASVNALIGSPEHLVSIYNAAVSYLALLQPCDQCGGSGVIEGATYDEAYAAIFGEEQR